MDPSLPGDPSSGAAGPTPKDVSTDPTIAPDLAPERRWVARANRGAGAFVAIEDDDVSAPGEAEQMIEQERLHRVIPRVRPRTTEELEVEPPPKQRYPVEIGRALRELWSTREVLLTFVERDLRVRYKQAALGAFWAIVQPIMLMVIFTVVFGKIAKVGSEGLPYPVFAYSALVPWSLFTSSISYATSSIVGNSAIVRKIHMPREIFALSGIVSSGVDFLISFVILVGLLIFYRFSAENCAHCLPGRTWLALPILVVVLVMLTVAVSLVAAAVTVYFRDTRYGIPMLMQILLYATPVAYPISKLIGPCQQVPGLTEPQCGVLHGFWADAYQYLNPLAPIMNGFRRVLTLGQWPEWGPLGAAGALSFAAMCLAYAWYKRIDRTFADVI
jgi:lipopolysaccharide transport system permease protein